MEKQFQSEYFKPAFDFPIANEMKLFEIPMTFKYEHQDSYRRWKLTPFY